MQRWEFLKDNKKQEKERKHPLHHENDQEKVFFFLVRGSVFVSFFLAVIGFFLIFLVETAFFFFFFLISWSRACFLSFFLIAFLVESMFSYILVFFYKFSPQAWKKFCSRLRVAARPTLLNVHYAAPKIKMLWKSTILKAASGGETFSWPGCMLKFLQNSIFAVPKKEASQLKRSYASNRHS